MAREIIIDGEIICTYWATTAAADVLIDVKPIQVNVFQPPIARNKTYRISGGDTKPTISSTKSYSNASGDIAVAVIAVWCFPRPDCTHIYQVLSTRYTIIPGPGGTTHVLTCMRTTNSTHIKSHQHTYCTDGKTRCGTIQIELYVSFADYYSSSCCTLHLVSQQTPHHTHHTNSAQQNHTRHTHYKTPITKIPPHATPHTTYQVDDTTHTSYARVRGVTVLLMINTHVCIISTLPNTTHTYIPGIYTFII